jgi:hypothetical protein
LGTTIRSQLANSRTRLAVKLAGTMGTPNHRAAATTPGFTFRHGPLGPSTVSPASGAPACKARFNARRAWEPPRLAEPRTARHPKAATAPAAKAPSVDSEAMVTMPEPVW